ncbi:hypothetical protein V8J82_17195 [Gymnodinialimonas sp. 2305UL16-5]|uniref:hypothetical protein n=1 Tax=Gymnodinialimonas mytili TaxID=3126503 RepID=UPI0030B34AB2
MPNSVHLIPRNRLGWIPSDLRLAHEYCFFLHDESARLLVEYEQAEAHVVSFSFRNKADAKAFNRQATKDDPITAMRAGGYEAEVRKVVLNQITMAMVSDYLHHIYEALRCLEKRKVVVALNLLRKPLTDNLLYLSWMLGDEDGFYHTFTTNSPRGITPSILKSRRAEILSSALAMTEVADVLNAEFIDRALFNRAKQAGFQKLFQHAVHLVTVQRVELETTPENFNFIFKCYEDDDLYELIYDVLPHVLLYLSHVIFGLFERIAASDPGGTNAFRVRSILGLYLVEGEENEANAMERLADLTCVKCPDCRSPLKITPHNAARLVLTESYRCASCRRSQAFPFSWIF